MATRVGTRIVDSDSHFMPHIDQEAVRDCLPAELSGATRDMYARDAAVFLEAGSAGPRYDGSEQSPLRNADARIKVLDEELGVDLQVLIPHGVFAHPYGGSPAGGDKPLPIRTALCRAYNDVAAEAQKRHPNRFVGTAIVPFDDLDESRDEVQRAVKKLALQAVMLPGNWLGQNFDAIELFPFWETVNELDIPVFVHQIPQTCGGSAVDHVSRYPMVGHERMHRLHIGTYLGFGLEYAMCCAALTLGGVLDEFPNLRFCFFEAGAGWLPYAMLGCDRSFYVEPGCSRTKTRPSELIKKHCFTAVESMENVPALIQMTGNDNFFFGTDYPHPEYRQLPNMPSSFSDRDGLTVEDKENILGRTMLRVLRQE